MIRRFVSKIYHGIKEIYRINYIATLYVNFRLLPFKQACFFPVICYGRIRLHYLKGRFEILAPVKKGMIRIGYRWLDLWPISYLPTQLNILGTVRFVGSAVISGGVNLTTQSKVGTIEIGNAVTIGGGTILKSIRLISIGDRTRVTGGCTIMDSNIHYVKNISTGRIAPNTGEIHIGKRCWINYGSVITKGASIPDYSIVARNSFVGKNYDNLGTNLFLAGSPAKILSSGVQRIFDYTREAELNTYFVCHPDREFYQDMIGVKNELIPFDI